jgi:hypothetical protein
MKILGAVASVAFVMLSVQFFDSKSILLWQHNLYKWLFQYRDIHAFIIIGSDGNMVIFNFSPLCSSKA